MCVRASMSVFVFVSKVVCVCFFFICNDSQLFSFFPILPTSPVCSVEESGVITLIERTNIWCV